MGMFILKRLGVMILTALGLTIVVFFMTNLYPNLEKLAKTQGNFRMSEEEVATWLNNRGYTQSMAQKYGEWLGVLPGYVIEGTDGEVRARWARVFRNGPWQLEPWAEYRWISAEKADYYFGVDTSEAIAGRPRTKIGSTVSGYSTNASE